MPCHDITTSEPNIGYVSWIHKFVWRGSSETIKMVHRFKTLWIWLEFINTMSLCFSFNFYVLICPLLSSLPLSLCFTGLWEIYTLSQHLPPQVQCYGKTFLWHYLISSNFTLHFGNLPFHRQQHRVQLMSVWQCCSTGPLCVLKCGTDSTLRCMPQFPNIWETSLCN